MIIKGDFSNKYTINELLNKKNICDGLILMKNISDEVISTAFFDPQYRGDLISSIMEMRENKEVRQDVL